MDELRAENRRATREHLAALDERLRAVADRVELVALADRYFCLLDEQEFPAGWADSVFTEDAFLEFPGRLCGGRSTIAEFLRRDAERYDRTQRVGADHLVTVHGDAASLCWNSIETGACPAGDQDRYLSVGGRYRAEAARTSDGWRLTHLFLRLIWTTDRGR
ncbi:nuclear transport factor 2 family protein [Saccharopolyspora sp. NFXS83]|uniref:nuclear transport factor 2 family protein n=1 Tax=Saccharopolyspora sp. NFXS83 TaxID=2993560 RepID=UPI00224AAB3E|nr:nuclear transport factor 2 family protein [Saccharopolyspora sp. NFXS83]MCX2731484.1 nuclear transport factor 2 family protein [Saccharopolyspora sp. NFXS83]